MRLPNTKPNRCAFWNSITIKNQILFGFSEQTFALLQSQGFQYKRFRLTSLLLKGVGYLYQTPGKLHQIKLLKEFGFTLREIKYLFNLGESELAECGSVSELVDEKVSVIEEKIDELNE